MRNVPALTRREINSYFLSPLAYIVMTVFLIFCGLCFFIELSRRPEATMRETFEDMSFVLMLAAPMITMRLLAEEVRSGTIETLMTAAVTDFEVITAKFAGAFCFCLIMLAPTLSYPVILEVLGKPDWGAILAGYVGILLLTALFLSVGLLASTLTRNQIVAGIVSLVALLVLWVIGFAAPFVRGAAGEFLRYIGTFTHLDAFRKGLIDTRDVVYYLTMTLFCLFLSVRALETRKWR